MRETIENFNKQFEYEPKIIHPENFRRLNKFLIAGMSGSNLVADLVRIRDPRVDAIVHRDYGLPALARTEIASRLFIASSYSGNTEETIDALKQARKAGFSSVAITTGGALKKLAQKHNLPLIEMPRTGIQPRAAVGYSLRALLLAMGRADLLDETRKLADTLRPLKFEKAGRKLAEALRNRVPVIYASLRNAGIAYNWKVRFNETGKIPAFYNVFPDLNHNEMTGFDVKDSTRKLSRPFHFLFLKDTSDHPRIGRRMTMLKKLYENRGLPVTTIELGSGGVFHKIFSSLILADWAAYYTAEGYGVKPEEVPMVEEFKKLIA